MIINDYRPVTRRLELTEFCVEATGFEQLTLWKAHALGSPYRSPDGAIGTRLKSTMTEGEGSPRYTWEQESPGTGQLVGTFHRHHVTISIAWVRLDGRRVMFWEGASQVTHSGMLEDWIRKECPNLKVFTNAMNFWHVTGLIVSKAWW